MRWGLISVSMTVCMVIVFGALAVWRPVMLLNAMTSTATCHRTTGLAYGDAPRQYLDLYVPTRFAPSLSGQGMPIVVFFYGGSWQSGDRAIYRFVGEALASRGFIVVIPDYRVYPQAVFPTFVDDAAAAVRWAQEHAGDWHGDPHRIFLMGHSAGAQIAALLATDDRFLRAQGMSKRDITGLIGLAGPYDFLPLKDPTLEQIFPAPQREASQPIRWIQGDEPPMLLITGTDDTMVDPANTDRFASALRSKGDHVEVQHYAHISHAMLIGTLARPLRALAPTLAASAQFMTSLAQTSKASQASQPQTHLSTQTDKRLTYPSGVGYGSAGPGS